jgi:hypothetical protein
MNATITDLKVQQAKASKLVYPAVPGEFYDYVATFTPSLPLYVLLKCKSQKSRAIEFAAELGDESNILFQFGDAAYVHSVEKACDAGLMGDIDPSTFGQTWLAPAGIDKDAFDGIRARQDVDKLVNTCTTACHGRQSATIKLEPNTVYAVMTDAGKYGLFVATKVTSSEIDIVACHILI